MASWQQSSLNRVPYLQPIPIFQSRWWFSGSHVSSKPTIKPLQHTWHPLPSSCSLIAAYLSHFRLLAVITFSRQSHRQATSIRKAFFVPHGGLQCQASVAPHRRKYGGLVTDTRCKGCTGNFETQEHCLNVCQTYMPPIKVRHDRVMERLVGAIPDSLGTKFLDQTVPGCLGLPWLDRCI